MLEETSLEEKKNEAQKLLEQFKSAINQPRLYVYQFFENMRNEIDIQSFKALNETNKERIYEHQAKLIVKVQEFESFCLEQLVDKANDFQVIIEQVETILNGAVVFQAELDRINVLLSNELLKVEKVLFQDKSMFFLKNAKIDNESADTDDGEIADQNDDKSAYCCSITFNLKTMSKIIERKNMFGLLITVEDCFTRREIFNKK